MPLLTADDIIPLVASLSDSERIKLLKWIASPHVADAVAYKSLPPTRDEFGRRRTDGMGSRWVG